ncbi:AAA family ATPase [Neptunomonas qingdaonensis]|uniref:Predicted ATP-dependent endonuclease of the OLD family, contains P-loop ATPase and TOPRIM domains n=1 Tax=Neptunomonas qingdaonensis TaxID=1045558 RepID=A0A1I2P9P1_9GAMM|nr:AAA family ATPase [Neptunomonas qingdaonensis]SFG10356.1 Predicted ATP-dependent endonuclease of the OLD family, contains P-loop ATPase and TOPRIM domains [Neptunomonas qingdaonensis]
MHLESLTIKNYRKFRSTDNTVCFVKPEVIDMSIEEKQSKSVIAPSTTLIIGKNNAGKTTVVNALKMLCNNEQPSTSDFNLSYLNELFNKYKQAFNLDPATIFELLETPNLEFTLSIKVDFEDADLMTHLAPFMSISEEGNGEPVSVRIVVNVVFAEEFAFKEEVSKIFKATGSEGNKQRFDKFYALLSKETSVIQAGGNLYKIEFVDFLGYATEKFSLGKLINIKEIKANRHLKEGVLSNVFNKIVSFQFTNDNSSRSDLEASIESINAQISENVGSKSTGISQVLGEVESSNKVDLNLSGNVTYDAIMKGLIKYNFMDGDDYIPEDQFGLGYINLLNIIGEIIHFVDSYEDKSHFSRINLLFIEEPEAFMHPQMQEFFIKRIDNAVKKALEIANASSKDTKTLQCQIAITTHSSHIVNSKIHSSNTFNNINYLTSINKCTKAINLTDESVVSSNDSDANKNLNFIKKHIKYKVSELFFSDAIIFVEGITEETLLNYYLENHPSLSEYYISVFNINGAHGKLYLPLAKKLSVPSLIVTDLDIKREKCEKGEKHKKSETCVECNQQAEGGDTSFVAGSDPHYLQITSLASRTTTNSTLIDFNHTLKGKPTAVANKIHDIEFFEDDNLYVVFQKDPIEGQHATSLEEALILTNYQNDIINGVIKGCKPEIYKDILNDGGEESLRNLINHSYKLQKKLSDSKSKFSNELIFNLLSADQSDVLPQLPNYLKDGLHWLVNKLQTNDTPSLSLSEVVDEEDESTTIESSEAASDDAE